jgi:ATP-dependent helicase Lhr and Lhr-like helicase
MKSTGHYGGITNGASTEKIIWARHVPTWQMRMAAAYNASMDTTAEDGPFFLTVTPSASDALAALPPFLGGWFVTNFVTPTPIQRLSWPALATYANLLISAPTGTGKTWAAFLPILSDLLHRRDNLPPDTPDSWSDSPLRCLYVSPLKALSADAFRNLESALTSLAPYLPPGTPRLRIALRTGDTGGHERRQLRDEPPEILLTTPESLAILLASPSSAALFANLRWVVVDEVHALAGNKRGADLAVCLERLALLTTNPPRRVGLSATATPLTEAARFLVGPGRSCAIAHAAPNSPPLLTLEPLDESVTLVRALVERLLPELPDYRSTLIFTTTRALAEQLGWALRRRMAGWDSLIAVHHSAISARRRREVEERFKAGALRVVVSSTSLELGIDIGPVERVVLVHPPGDVVRLLQRIGRAGHAPGRIGLGLVLTRSAAELLEATVTAASGLSFQCEPLRMAHCPLDVLCQQIVGMTSARPCEAKEMFAVVKRSAPFADLTWADFDDSLRYLRGLDREESEWLPARLREDGDCFRIRDVRTARLLRRNLGTILAEKTTPVLLRPIGSVAPTAPVDDFDALFGPPPEAEPIHLGEVDEAFAERLQPGDRFLLDGRCLEFRSMHEGTVLVDEVFGRPRTPHWGGDGLPLSPELAARLYLLRIRAAEALREGMTALRRLLEEEYGLAGQAADVLADYFERQERVSEIPDTSTLLIEGVSSDQGVILYFHTPLNRAANDAVVRVVGRRLVRDHGLAARAVVADLGFALVFRSLNRADIAELARRLLVLEGFDDELDAELMESYAIRDRFRRVAQTGLMVLRNPAGRKRRVGGAGWSERQLFDQVRTHDADFVLIRQSLREVRAERVDGPAGRKYLESVPGLTIRVRWMRQPSPFAEAWTQPGLGEIPAAESPTEALRRLHEQLTGQDRQGA